MQKMSLTPDQIRAARALVGWSQSELAERAELSRPTIDRAERSTVSAGALDRIREVLEGAGLIFIDENGEGPGVRLRKRLGGKSASVELLHDLADRLDWLGKTRTYCATREIANVSLVKVPDGLRLVADGSSDPLGSVVVEDGETRFSPKPQTPLLMVFPDGRATPEAIWPWVTAALDNWISERSKRLSRYR